ncbi:MAG: RNA-binding domain-containing protein [Pyrinomonadaceae bacterium]
MTEKDFIAKLDELRNLPNETEIFELFELKEEKGNSFSSHEMGKYFSALSNEANLKNADCAWLIFGVEDKHRKIVGTEYNNGKSGLDNLKQHIADNTTDRISFIEIHELKLPDGRVIMFQIPPAPCGVPTTWKGHYYGRNGSSISSLSPEKRRRIESQTEKDWSAEICPDARISDLDPDAIAKAGENYKVKFPDKTVEVNAWSNTTFLNKAKITIQGKITRTAIILLGKEESEHFLSPADIKIRWVLKDSLGIEKDYQIESCPFILAVDKIYSKIRKLKYRYIREGTLFPDEIDQYEPFVIREAINNCIAHQDYSLAGRINVIESEDQLIFTNVGSFIPDSVEKVIQDDAPEEKYRNKFLATAMVNLNMVDTIGSGIKKMFLFQKNRFFPLPEYDFSDNKVKVTITGKVLDMDYADVLARDNDLTLEEIIMLDKVQKRKLLNESENKHLRKKGLIEGKKPNVRISLKLAQKIGRKVEYSKAKGLDKSKQLELILSYIKDHEYAERKDIDNLLWNILSNLPDDKQKKVRINNLISELRRNGEIRNDGSDTKPRWILSN